MKSSDLKDACGRSDAPACKPSRGSRVYLTLHEDASAKVAVAGKLRKAPPEFKPFGKPLSPPATLPSGGRLGRSCVRAPSKHVAEALGRPSARTRRVMLVVQHVWSSALRNLAFASSFTVIAPSSLHCQQCQAQHAYLRTNAQGATRGVVLEAVKLHRTQLKP